MSKILTITLNPALDVAAVIDELEPSRKLRCREPHMDPGGGGVNVSRAIKILGGETTPFVAAGGPTGELLISLLAEEGLEPVHFRIDGITRQSFAVRETSTKKQYRFILPGPEWDERLGAAALKAASEAAEHKQYIVISGSLPPGVSNHYYVDLIAALANGGARIVIDTSDSALEAVLKATSPNLFCVRFNWAEAQAAAGCTFANSEEAVQFARELINRGLSANIIVTRGADGAIVASGEDIFQIAAPKVKAVSAVGAGDSFMGAFVLGMAKGDTVKVASSYGVAAAASAMTTPGTELCRRADTERYFKDILK